jgi:hypothetical protein
LVIYILVSSGLKGPSLRKMSRIFAFAGVSCYYWYRIPALFGFGRFGKDGLLVDLKNSAPEWSMAVMSFAAMTFFFYWMLIRKEGRRSWVIRPEYAESVKAV